MTSLPSTGSTSLAMRKLLARIERHTHRFVSWIQKLMVLVIRECCYNFKKKKKCYVHFTQLSRTLVSLNKMVYKKKTINKVTTVTRDKNGQNETIYLSAFTCHTRKLACKMQPTFNIMTDLSTTSKKKKSTTYVL